MQSRPEPKPDFRCICVCSRGKVSPQAAIPSILGGLTINVIAMIEYSAIAGTIGAGGIGYVAVTYGYQRFDQGVMLATIVSLVLTVAAVQLTGDALVRATTPRSAERSILGGVLRRRALA